MASYTLTLNRAHKVVDRLRARATELGDDIKTSAGSVALRVRTDTAAKSRAEQRSKTYAVSVAAYIEVLKAIQNAKVAIGSANDTHGVNALLAEQDFLSKQIQTFKEAVSAANLDSAVELDDVPVSTSEEDRYDRSQLHSLTVEQRTELQSMVRTLQTAVHSVSDRLADANRAQVRLSLSDEHAAIAGLTGSDKA